MPCITRFAPSPSGSLHLGGARTALFNFIHAKSNNGLFKLRIEDTDKLRNSKESVNSILNGLNWLGLKPDGEIIYQNKQIDNHLKIAYKMLADGFAYKCYHSEKEIENLRKNNKKFRSKWRETFTYPKNKKYCIRIKAPLEGQTTIHDKIQGKVTVNNNELDDYIILRTDGTPTFLLSSATDDFLMSVSDIIRGDDHLTNSFRQMEIFKYLKYMPSFAHIPLIHNEENKKLSKRDNALSIDDYKNSGYFSESIINYMLRLGWSLGDEEIITLEKAIKNFKIVKVGKSPSKLDKKKLFFLNNFYIKNKNENEILKQIEGVEKLAKLLTIKDKKLILGIIKIYKERSNTLVELLENINEATNNEFIFTESEKLMLENSINLKTKIIDKLARLETWNDYMISNELNDFVNQMGLKFKEIGQPLRLCIFGSLNGPSISKFMEIIGKDNTTHRIIKNWKISDEKNNNN